MYTNYLNITVHIEYCFKLQSLLFVCTLSLHGPCELSKQTHIEIKHLFLQNYKVYTVPMHT